MDVIVVCLKGIYVKAENCSYEKSWTLYCWVQKKCLNVKMSKTAGSSMKFSPQNYYFHQPLTVAICNCTWRWNTTPLGEALIDGEFILLVWNNCRKLALKPSFLDASSCLQAEWLFFSSSFKKPNCATKEKPVQIFFATLKRLDECREHKKQSSKAIFIPLQFEVLKLKLHMDAIETRATRGD